METLRDEITTTHLSNEVQRIQNISKDTSQLMSVIILTVSVLAFQLLVLYNCTLKFGFIRVEILCPLFIIYYLKIL
jgi:hypothetical protein